MIVVTFFLILENKSDFIEFTDTYSIYRKFLKARISLKRHLIDGVREGSIWRPVKFSHKRSSDLDFFA